MIVAAVVFLAAAIVATTTTTTAQPYTDCDVSTYYSSLLDITSRDDMHNLLKSTHRNQLPYSSSSYGDTWDALISLDSDDDANTNVKLIYKDEWVPSIPYDYGTCQFWNREHLWSRSHGVGTSGKDNTDLHHLRPSDCNVNSARSNLYYGECGIASPASKCVTPAHVEAAVDTAKDGSTFLPPADRRGDIARAILYMDLRYDGDEGSTTLDLIVSDCPQDVPNNAGMGYLSQLLQWHIDDPPDEAEKQRNEQVCAEWQGNRNPFIDYPELAGVYHGGSRPLIGEGLGYDCSVPPPPAPTNSPTEGPDVGVCSDESGSCSSVDDCFCASSTQERSLLRGDGRNLQPSSSSSALIITGILDGPLPGGLPKMIELYSLQDIDNLGQYGIGSANNGGGSDGEEFTLSGSTNAGSYITISYETSGFESYFNGEAPTFVSGKLNMNGDDGIELFYNGEVVDVFGNANVDGTNQVWEYMDGFAYRTSFLAANDGSMFDINEWTLSGKNALDGCSSNDSCESTFPLKSFQHSICECVLG